MELQIDPEPSPEERAAIVAALEEVGVIGAEEAPAWGRPAFDDEVSEPPPGA
jgi:hypothetical protein